MDPVVVRLGRRDAIAASSQAYHLDILLEERLANQVASAEPDAQSRVEAIQEKLAKLGKDVRAACAAAAQVDTAGAWISRLCI